MYINHLETIIPPIARALITQPNCLSAAASKCQMPKEFLTKKKRARHV